MNSIEILETDEILEEILRSLDPEYIRQEIINPIEKAASNFIIETRAPMTHKNFLKVTGDFVKLIYKSGLGFPKKLTDSQACSEAVSILDESYQSVESAGYFAAFLDARNSKLDGVEQVLRQIAEHIMEKERSKYVKWVFATKYHALNWQTQNLITRSLIKKWKHVLPSNITDWPPSQLVHHLPQFFIALSSVNSQIDKLANSNIEFKNN